MTHTFSDTETAPSGSWPSILPALYEGREDLADAYRRGWNHGHGFASHNVPTLGDKLFVEDMGHIIINADNIREVHAALCYTAEGHSRCYSPFEFTAREFNSADCDEDGAWDPELEGRSEELWEAFERGTSDAISADLATYDDADYGIEPETEDGE